VFGRGVVDLLSGVEPQAVQMVFVDPVCRVGEKEFAHRAGLLAVEIDRVAPLVRVAVGEVVLGELFKIVAVGSEVVVDDIKDYAQAERVGSIDEAAEVVRLAVKSRGREEIDAVIAPTETTRENQRPA
jgi:hypothetical protein